MKQVVLAGPLADPELRCVVLGYPVDGAELALDDAAVARVEHYARATGLPMTHGRQYGDDDGQAGPLERLAAEEIMDAMGRIAPETLLTRRAMIGSRAAARLEAHGGVRADVRSACAASDVEVFAREAVHEGFFVTRAMELSHPTFGGGMSERVRREVFVATDAAIVLPYDPRRDRVLLIEQFRMGPFGRDDPMPWTLEPIAGRVDGGERPEETARREAREEAGLVLHDLEQISRHYCSPGCSTEYFHIFLGLCDLPDRTQGQGGLDTEHEDIRTHVLGFADAMRLLDTGEADNGPLVLSLLWLSKERDRLRANA